MLVGGAVCGDGDVFIRGGVCSELAFYMDTGTGKEVAVVGEAVDVARVAEDSADDGDI